MPTGTLPPQKQKICSKLPRIKNQNNLPQTKSMLNLKQRNKNFILASAIFTLIGAQLVRPLSVISAATLTAPTAPTAPEEPEAPEAPEAPTAPEAPEAPTAPEEPIAPTAPEAPTLTSDPDPDTNDDSETDTASSTPDSPVVYSEPDSSLTPVTEDSASADSVNIETGDATTTGTITNIGNTNLSSDTATAGIGDSAILTNADNGTDSTNSSNLSETDSSITLQDNLADVGASLTLDSDTGENSNSYNTGGDAFISTGDANVTGTIVNSLNTNIDGVLVAEFDIADDYFGDIILDFAESCISGCGIGELTIENINNGTESDNSGEVTIVDDSFTFQNNDAAVENELILAANTGNNLTDSNTNSDSFITTGDANISANVLNFINNNIAGQVIYAVINIFGDLVGDIIIPADYLDNFASNSVNLANINGGEGSTNTITYGSAETNDIFQFNTADISNDVTLSAISGDNTVSGNTNGDSSIMTGDTSIDAQIVNIANSNITAGNWWIVLINEAGEWFGRILGAPEGSLYAGSLGTEFTVNDDGGLNITNDGNGTDSTNTLAVDHSTTTTITQVNDAIISNTISLSANTGGNSASHNTGGSSSIETGDANIMLNLVNFINNNFVGDSSVLYTVVNVFGSWIGDLIPPGETKEALAAESQEIGSEEYVIQEIGSLASSQNQTPSSDAPQTPASSASPLGSESSSSNETSSGIEDSTDYAVSTLASALPLDTSNPQPTTLANSGNFYGEVNSATAVQPIEDFTWIFALLILAFSMQVGFGLAALRQKRRIYD